MTDIKTQAAGVSDTPAAGRLEDFSPLATSTIPLRPHFEKLLKAAQVAEYLDVSRSTAYKLMRSGALPVVRFGPGVVRVRPADLEVYVARCVEGGLE